MLEILITLLLLFAQPNLEAGKAEPGFNLPKEVGTGMRCPDQKGKVKWCQAAEPGC